jgi:hypothetical protein
MPATVAALFRKYPVRVAIAPVTVTCEVGRPVAVRVVATGLEDSTIREASAGLVMRVWLRKPQVVVGPWGAAPPSRAPQRVVAGVGSRLSLAGDLPAGATAECEATLPNWALAPTGGRSPGRRIEYAVRAQVRLASGRTVRSEAPVLLVSGPELYREVEGAHRSRRSRRCDIELIAPALRARPGETLRGSVRVVPHRPVRARSVLLFVVRTQTVPERQRAVWARRLGRDVELGGPQEFAFEAPVPIEAPTIITPYLSVHWHLRAVVRYRALAADRLDTEVNVYTGPL